MLAHGPKRPARPRPSPADDETARAIAEIVVYGGMIAQLGAAEAARRWEAEEAERRNAEAHRQHVEGLVRRFGPASAERIMRREIWVGMSAAELMESRGRPADVDEKVLKTKTKHVFKYEHQGGAKYGLRVTLDDGIVVGWDDKR